MEPLPIPAFTADGCQLVIGDDHVAVALDEAERARIRLWISMFLIGLSAPDDLRLSVRFVLDAVVRAGRRGVDVRVLVDDFRSGPARVRSNAAAAGYLARRGVPVRVWAEPRPSGEHTKLIVADRTVVCGSANWTPGGLDRNYELAVRVRSGPLADDLARSFDSTWAAAVPWDRDNASPSASDAPDTAQAEDERSDAQ
ncbi:phospholipase D family protein [Streptomyces sp. NPDC002156]